MKFRYIFFLFFILLQPTLKAANFIVAKDGSGDFTTVQAAFDACPDGSRSFIFVKNGTYYGQTFIGTKATPTNKYITLIGASRDSVIMTYDVACSTTVTFEQSCTFQVYSKYFYAENIKFVNSAGNTGQALALYTAGDQAILKNCSLIGYQDTYRSKKGTRGYLTNCWVEGAVDFIYAGGTFFFDDCTINCIRSGGFITAPEDCYATVPKASTAGSIFLRLGFIFRNCTIKGPASVPANSFYLGRPWGDYAGTAYLNCKLSDQVHSAGWATMGSSTYLTSCFAEYNSMDLNGNPMDISKRISWSYQLLKADVDNHLTMAAVYAKSYTTAFDPINAIIQTTEPKNVKFENMVLSWDITPNAVGYIIYTNNKYLGYSATNNFTVSSGSYTNITIKAMNTIGVLSNVSQIISATNKIPVNELKVKIQNKTIIFTSVLNEVSIYSINGTLIKQIKNAREVNLEKTASGCYLIKAIDSNKNYLSTKLTI